MGGFDPVVGFVTLTNPNFRAPDLSRISFSGGLDIKGTYKNCRKIKRKFYDMSVVLNFITFVKGLMTRDKMHRELCFIGFRRDLF